jgi:hypothetical protein
LERLPNATFLYKKEERGAWDQRSLGDKTLASDMNMEVEEPAAAVIMKEMNPNPAGSHISQGMENKNPAAKGERSTPVRIPRIRPADPNQEDR